MSKRIMKCADEHFEVWTQKDAMGRLYLIVACPDRGQGEAIITVQGGQYDVRLPSSGYLGGYNTHDLRLAMEVAAGMILGHPIQNAVHSYMIRFMGSYVGRMSKAPEPKAQKAEEAPDG